VQGLECVGDVSQKNEAEDDVPQRRFEAEVRPVAVLFDGSLLFAWYLCEVP
jgi:hypothetical protein